MCPSPSVVLQHLPEGHGAKQAGRLLAGEGVVREVAHQVLLVKDGAVTTEEAVLGGAGHKSLVVLDGQADVEDLGRVSTIFCRTRGVTSQPLSTSA